MNIRIGLSIDNNAPTWTLRINEREISGLDSATVHDVVKGEINSLMESIIKDAFKQSVQERWIESE